MKSKKGFISISTILFIIFVVATLAMLFRIYKNNCFNDFIKAVTDQEAVTKLSRDSKVKYSKSDSYKIENKQFNDAIFYKQIEVEPNTPYRISCVVKTEDIRSENPKKDAGAMIWIMDSLEYSIPVTGTKDWQEIELIFNSKNRQTVDIAFRLGGNNNNCIGTAWFSDFKLEKGTKHTDTEWNVGCFILKKLDVNIDGVQRSLYVNQEDIKNVYENMERYKNTAAAMSNNLMSVKYDVYEIDEPVTTISYDEEHGYYIDPSDTKDLIYDTIYQNEYDHVFVVARMEDENGVSSIPIKGNWVGLRSNRHIWNRLFNSKNK
jgi:hypothetical protein